MHEIDRGPIYGNSFLIFTNRCLLVNLRLLCPSCAPEVLIERQGLLLDAHLLRRIDQVRWVCDVWVHYHLVDV